uniref:Uncharacterized protein n=1 Tax=Anguilla anguilla TaxID=7936 RepID=A0A0E9QY73_ANGAN
MKIEIETTKNLLKRREDELEKLKDKMLKDIEELRKEKEQKSRD